MSSMSMASRISNTLCFCQLRASLEIKNLGPDRRRIGPEEDEHGSSHGQRVKDIDGPLHRQQEPVVALNIFRHTEDVSNHDQRADGVEDEECFLPSQVWIAGLLGRALPQTVVKEDGSQDEQAEHDDLKE